MNLFKAKFQKFHLSEIKPKGWIKRQLELQFEGLSGHLQEFWPDIRDSAWFGGCAEGWERAPYWLDGMIPLVTLLDNNSFSEKLDGYMNYILEHQHADGWLGPKNSNSKNPEAKEGYDIWAQFLILKVLVEYYELKNDVRIMVAIERGLRKIEDSINWTPLFDWGQARWFEALIPIIWLYEKKPEEWLLSLATKLQAQGFSWDVFFKNWPMKNATPKGGWNFMSHVVNNAMAIKAYALVYQLTGAQENKITVENILSQLEEYHGTAVGTITGDECLAGKSPTRGTELCSAVEMMYSFEHVLRTFGESKYADKLEKIAFNALPAYFTNDMWCHQYNQQVNQIAAVEDSQMPWGTNDPDANIYGLEPHFGCCTSNYHQGFPKFVANSWLKSENNTIISALFIPSLLTTSIRNNQLSIELKTDYPFKNQLTYLIDNPSNENFTLWIRIPGWSESCEILFNNKRFNITQQEIFYPLEIKQSGEIIVNFNASVKPLSRPQNNISIEYGALVFAYPLAARQTIIHQDRPYREFPHCDIEMRTTDNCYIAINNGLNSQINNYPIATNYPYSINQPSITIELDGGEYRCKGESEVVMTKLSDSLPLKIYNQKRVTLVPFGATYLRVAEFPQYIKEKSDDTRNQ